MVTTKLQRACEKCGISMEQAHKLFTDKQWVELQNK